ERFVPVIAFTSPAESGFLYNPDPKIEAIVYMQNTNIALNWYSLAVSVKDSSNVSYAMTVTHNSENSTFELVPTADLPENTYTVTASISDILGNASGVKTWHVKVDRTPPDIRFVTPFNGSNVATTNPIFSGTFIDLQSGIDF